MTDEAYSKAVEFALKHLAAIGPPDVAYSSFWALDPADFGIQHRQSESGGRYDEPHVTFLADGEAAERLLNYAKNDPLGFDLACTICANNLLQQAPLPNSLIEFSVSRILGNVERPKARRGQNDAKRNRVIARLIWEVWTLFDLTEYEARDAVKEASHRFKDDHGKPIFPLPVDLRDLWEASEERQAGLGDRTEALKRQVRADTEARLAHFQSLDARLGNSSG